MAPIVIHVHPNSNCKIAIDNGADPNSQDIGGMAALHYVLVNRKPELMISQYKILQLLLANGADPNLQGGNRMRPLNYAVYNKYMIACHLLIEHGADINAIVNDGKTIVEYEISKCNIKAVEILRELGAKTAYELEQEKMKGR